MGVWGEPHPHIGHKRGISPKPVTGHLKSHTSSTAAHSGTGHHSGGNHTNHHGSHHHAGHHAFGGHHHAKK